MADYKYDFGISPIPSTASSTSGNILDSSITVPVIISTITLDTITPTVGGSTVITQNISSIGPAIVQSGSDSLRMLIPVIDSSNVVSLAEVYYTYTSELLDIKFTAVLKVLGI